MKKARACRTSAAVAVALGLAAAGSAPTPAAAQLLATQLSPAQQAGRSAVALDYYLPPEVTYDRHTPLPSSVLGFEVGEWHARPDQQEAYLRTLAASSERMRLETLGHSYEGRPILNLVVSSPANLARLDEVFAAQCRLGDPAAAPPDTAGLPVVVYLGYSIHGNEASGANAALLVAYHLAAARGPEIDALLERAVVLLDPALNPDGLARFTQWVNMHHGRAAVADPDHREHREAWPSGRTNHYWFDLNRDWLLAQHPETRARLERLHRTCPNVLADFHEMETGSTFFFQPGVPSRQNPLTPARNLELTRDLAAFHARALDRAGSLYYTEERFDDFYFGKGSTYPDLQGSVGILFEQASARGHVQETNGTLLTFPFAIRNQLLASLSTLEGAVARRRELLDYRAEFFRTALAEAAEYPLRGYVFGDPLDPARTHHFLELLLRHHVAVYRLASTVERGPDTFAAGTGYVVPLAQPQYRLIRALFETRRDFADTTFYDISTWTLPLAYGLPHAALDRGGWRDALLGERVTAADFPAGREAPDAGEAPYAYAFTWDGYYAPRALERLLDAGVRARVATRGFTAATPDGPRPFGRGTIVVPTGGQTVDPALLTELLHTAARRDALEVVALASGLTPQGVDLGSPTVRPLKLPRPALVVGEGVGAYEAGEIWYLLDTRIEMPLVLLEGDDVRRADLAKYSHLILVDGDYDHFAPPVVDKVRRWVEEGGVVVAMQGAAKWAGEHLVPPPTEEAPDEADRPLDPETRHDPSIVPPETETEIEPPAPGAAPGADPGATAPAAPLLPAVPAPLPTTAGERRPYDSFRDDRAAELVSGAILEVDLDLTHPLAFGYRRHRLPVFRNSRIVLPPPGDPYATVAAYTGSPLLSGYLSDDNLALLRQTPAIVAQRVKRGAVIRLADDPAFRGFWLGTDKLFLNALFFGTLLDDTTEP